MSVKSPPPAVGSAVKVFGSRDAVVVSVHERSVYVEGDYTGYVGMRNVEPVVVGKMTDPENLAFALSLGTELK